MDNTLAMACGLQVGHSNERSNPLSIPAVKRITLPMPSIKCLLKLAITCWAFQFAAVGHAQTITYQAITDFPVLDAGEVPYYIDEARQALAINAAINEYRDRFAKAEVVFDGQPGLYQLTLVALAELDGEADYRVSVNGEIVGLASNPEVTVDFSTVRHEFADINLPVGAVIAVESLANSNGKIPENDEFAFARGRWTALELSLAGTAVTGPDLMVSVDTATRQLSVGDDVQITIAVANTGSDTVATGITLLLMLPADALDLLDQSVCRSVSEGIECALSELAAGESTELTVTLRAISALSDAVVRVIVEADQSDPNEADNTTQLLLTVSDAPVTDPSEGTIDRTGVESETGSSTTPVTGNNTTPVTQNDSGGGSLSLLMFSVLLLFAVFRYERRQRKPVTRRT